MNLEIVSASAGSGKTTWLTGSMAEAFKAGASPDQAMAATFTRMAAQELSHRVRGVLMEAKMHQEANAIQDGLFGTINSTAGQLLEMFCWEAGLSPRMDVVEPQDAAILLRAALSAELDAEMTPRLAASLERLTLFQDSLPATVQHIIDDTRGNAIAPEHLTQMASQSEATFLQYLPEPLSKEAAHDLDQALWRALGEVVQELPSRDVIKTGKPSVERVQRLHRESRSRGYLAWSEWVALSKLNFGAKNKDLSDRLAQLCQNVLSHPLLRQDISSVIHLMFSLAQGTIDRFQALKQERGLIDFTDQESLTYQLLDQRAVRERLKERLKVLWVDEFQDSSPLELAVLQELAGIAERTWWVGDPKQAIYGFRGADPDLMNWASRVLVDPEQMRVLDTSYRTGPELVTLTNAIFEYAFERQKIPPRRVLLQPKRSAPPNEAPGFEIWHLEPKCKKPEAHRAIAHQVAEVLAHAESRRVEDRDTHEWRAIRGGDIAILCRTNDECREIAGQLNGLGVRASVGRTGLLDTPEVGYGLAALRLLWDPRDSLALAELVHLGTDIGGHGQWLAEWLEDPEGFSGKKDPRVLQLARGRETLSQLTLLEALDRSLVTAEAWSVVRGWPYPDIRTGNLEKLRAIAVAFEDRARSLRLAPTVPAFLGYLETVKDDETSEDNLQATSHDENAVSVLTYYKAKGLEWPMVVVTFKSERDPDPFGVRVVPAKAQSARRPLEGRWIRYWPWPFAQQGKGVGLTIGKELDEESQRVQNELTRLMYVAMTRARDYLVWVYPVGQVPDGLNGLETAAGRRILTLPEDPGDGLGVMDEIFPVAVHPIASQDGEESGALSGQPAWTVRKTRDDSWPRVLRRVVPSRLEAPPGIIEEQNELGPRVALFGEVDMTMLGEMVHAFLAASAHYLESEWPRLAEDTLKRWNLIAIQPQDLPAVTKRFREFMQNRYPGMIEHVEWPVELVHNNQFITGVVDSLWMGPQGSVIVDHKTFPGREEDLNAKGLGFLGQLQQYQAILEEAGMGPVQDLWIHFPIVGRMIRVRQSN